MKNVRKMVLIDYDENQKSKISDDIFVKPQPLFLLDREMSAILNSNDEIDTKLKKYNYVLRKFLFHKRNLENTGSSTHNDEGKDSKMKYNNEENTNLNKKEEEIEKIFDVTETLESPKLSKSGKKRESKKR